MFVTVLIENTVKIKCQFNMELKNKLAFKRPIECAKFICICIKINSRKNVTVFCKCDYE